MSELTPKDNKNCFVRKDVGTTELAASESEGSSPEIQRRIPNSPKNSPQYSQLAVELKLMIWEFALIDVPRRLINITLHRNSQTPYLSSDTALPAAYDICCDRNNSDGCERLFKVSHPLCFDMQLATSIPFSRDKDSPFFANTKCLGKFLDSHGTVSDLPSYNIETIILHLRVIEEDLADIINIIFDAIKTFRSLKQIILLQTGFGGDEHRDITERIKLASGEKYDNRKWFWDRYNIPYGFGFPEIVYMDWMVMVEKLGLPSNLDPEKYLRH